MERGTKVDTELRAKGSGSIYRRASDGLWLASVELEPIGGKRRRKVFTGKSRDAVLEKVKTTTGIDMDAEPERRAGRRERMVVSRSIGTHTDREWSAVVKATKQCRYCDTALDHLNAVKDHKVAVARGGSDAIENLQRICWECNQEKATLDHDDYAYAGEKPRPFRVAPTSRKVYEALMAAKARHGL